MNREEKKKEILDIILEHVDNEKNGNAFSYRKAAEEILALDDLVSVKDGLPKKQGAFLVLTPISFPKNIPFQVAEFYDDNNTFYNEYDHPLEDVTYYMPLPSPPKGK